MIDKVETMFTAGIFYPFLSYHSDTSITYEFLYEEKKALDPAAPRDFQRFNDCLDVLGKAVSKDDKEVAFELESLGGASYDLIFNGERIGFYMGTLMGAASMGASRQTLERIGEGIRNHYHGKVE